MCIDGIVSRIRLAVEKSFAWLDKCRRLSKNYERLFRSTKSMIVLAFVRLLVRRLTSCCSPKWVKTGNKVAETSGLHFWHLRYNHHSG